jgi:hypothetical protein
MWLFVRFTLIPSLLLHEEHFLRIQQKVGWAREYKQLLPRIEPSHSTNRVTRWRSKLRYCPTNRKVAGSIPDMVKGIFYWIHPNDRTMARRSTQPLAEMGTSNNSWGHKVGRWVGLTTLPYYGADCVEILGASTSWSPKG